MQDTNQKQALLDFAAKHDGALYSGHVLVRGSADPSQNGVFRVDPRSGYVDSYRAGEVQPSGLLVGLYGRVAN